MRGQRLQRLSASIDAFFSLGGAVEVHEDVHFVRNDALPRIHDANHGYAVRAVSRDAVRGVLERARERFGSPRTPFFYCDALTPAAFEAQLASEGYEATATVELLLSGELERGGSDVAIREARSDDDWRSVLELTRADHREAAAREKRPPYDADVTEGLVALRRARAPAVRTWLASSGRRDCAFVSSWPGSAGIGKVEDLFTRPDHRQRGIATRLIAHGVADARSRGAREVGIGARVGDTPVRMYAALGFEPVMLRRGWRRTDPTP
ncbi:MAG: GNAT family N-acetyltransferase [Deltaproteobacteria bacterium]|nr:MAG: GNAT family N-acetyltransferase [Deltaproteobacteria bacterium]